MFNILDPLGLWTAPTTTDTVGGGVNDQSKAPWYITPLVIITVIILVIVISKGVLRKYKIID